MTADQPMTAEQAATLKPLAEAAYELEAFQPNLTRAEADLRISMLTAKLKLFDGPPHTYTLRRTVLLSSPVAARQQRTADRGQYIAKLSDLLRRFSRAPGWCFRYSAAILGLRLLRLSSNSGARRGGFNKLLTTQD